MKTRIFWSKLVLFVVFMSFGLSHAQENILVNGGFEDGVLDPWLTYGNATFEVVTELTGALVPEDPIEGNYCVYINVPAAGTNFWDVWFKYPGLAFEKGRYYTFSAFVKCSIGTLQAMFKPELDQAPNTGYGAETLTITDEWQELYVTTPVFASSVSPADVVFLIAYDAAEFWIDGVRFYEGDFIPTVLETSSAVDPIPEDKTNDVCRDVVLSWTPGENAYAHDMYFGTVMEDVNDAERDNDPRGLLVGPGQDSNSYDPPSILEFGQTYYWRVDEVNAPPDTGVQKGNIWSFTTEPMGYPILNENIIATASSFNVDDTEQIAEQTVNGSGLEGDLHSRNVDDMWLTTEGAEGPAWIKYEFDKVYKLHEMLVWNYNGPSSLRFLGIKDVTVRYSVDDVNWITVPDVNEFAQATGSNNYAANTTVPFHGVSAKYVEIVAASNFSDGIFDQYGLSEVRFLYIPARARKPVPASGEADVALDAELSWRAGREADMHDIYFGTSRQQVAEATVPTESISGDSCEVVYVPSSLELGQRYYWRVVEIDPDSEVWESDIWSFSTLQNFVVDDFEDYNDFHPNEIFNTWEDGYMDTSNGSTAGYPDPDFLLLDEHYMETVIVHGGRQSMPFIYDNSGSVTYSEVTRTFNTPQDWTVKDVQMLTMFLRGDPPAFAEISEGNILMSGIGADIYQTTDEFNFAYKQLTGDGSITIRIDSIQYTHEWAKAGVMIRSSLEPLAQQADMIGAPSNRVEWAYRENTDGTTAGNDTGVDSITFPHWVRIRREGNTFIGEHSDDGVNWMTTTPGDLSSSSTTIQMPNTVYIGLVVTSHASDEACQAEFSEVSTMGNVTGQWQLADVGVEQNAGNTADNLYVVVEDNSGNSETYEHPDNPNAVLIGDWQQWDIPLSVFSDAGVNLTSVKKMTIGVGDRSAPLHGEGLLFVDDIWLYTPLPDPE